MSDERQWPDGLYGVGPDFGTSPRALVLDLGDTLLELTRYDLIAGVRALAGGAEGADEHVRGVTALLELQILGRYAEGWQEYRLADHLEWLATEAAGCVGHPADDPEVAFWDAAVTLSPMRGVHSALESLRARGIELCVVSNAIFSARILERELERHGLRQFVSFVVISSADHGFRKPHPSIFRAALDLLGTEPEQTWYVGDGWDGDVCGAAVSGLVPVWFTKLPEVRSATLRHLRVASWEALVTRAASSAR